MLTFHAPSSSTSSVPTSMSINNILNECDHVPLQISFVSEELGTDGSVTGTNTVVETHNAIFCEKHSIDNCEVAYDRLLLAMSEERPS